MLLLKGILRAKSPFMIGSGTGISSDQDVLKDKNGKAFIPGTSLAGVCRHYLAEKGVKEDLIESMFGIEKRNDKDKNSENKSIESNSIFYDSFLVEDSKLFYRVRDSVRLYRKLAVPKSKFDYEVVESGAAFVFRIELNEESAFDKEAKVSDKLCDMLIRGFRKTEIRLGAKTTRGFGEFDLTDVKFIRFDLSKPKAMKDYIDFSFDDSRYKWADWKISEESKTCNVFATENKQEADDMYATIEKKISLKNFLFIRDYSTADKVDAKDKKSKFVDAATLTDHDGKDHDGNVVIPGTAWAGVFRNHCRRILTKVKYKGNIKDLLNEVFGYETDLDENGELKPGKDDADKKSKSKILFSETKISKDEVVFLNRTRTAIDRFTGSALQTGALYTDRIACLKEKGVTGEETSDKDRGKGILRIKIKNDMIKKYPFLKSLIEACIDDLRDGVLAIGGSTAVGGGILDVS